MPAGLAAKVLLVATNASVRTHVQEQLRGVISVSAVADGKEALRWIRAHEVDAPPPVLVIMASDGKEGLAILTPLRNEQRVHPSPALMVLESVDPFSAPPGLDPEELMRGRYDRSDLIRRVRQLSRLALSEFQCRYQQEALQATEDATTRWRRAYDEANETLQSLTRFMPTAVVEAVREGRAFQPPQRRELTMLFSDIRGFTDATEFHEPQDTIDLLNDYLPEVNRIIAGNGGTLDKFLGDGILAYFGDRPGTDDHAMRAVRTAVAMQHRLEELKVAWFERGFLPVGIGIGICTGPTTLGTLGSGERMEYTVIGSPVNMAARLQGFARGGEIIISGTTYERVQSQVQIRETRTVTVKGFDGAVQVYTLAGIPGESGSDEEAGWFGE
ncbi:MAG: adenylate/guanylate cyclase domain-containing protein [Myxococcota bacterium]